DTQLLRCGALFVIPPVETTGWLGLHVNNNRGIKGLLEIGLWAQFTNQFDDHLLELTPFVGIAAFREAIEHDRIATVRLVQYEQPADRAVAATNRWVRGDEWGKIEVRMSPRGRGRRVATGLLRRWLESDGEEQSATLREILEFQNVEFDEAKIEAVLPDNTRR